VTHIILENAEGETSEDGKRKRSRGTDFLERAEGWTSQNIERKRVNEWRSQSDECRESDNSEQ
jgi:hypothetical protein